MNYKRAVKLEFLIISNLQNGYTLMILRRKYSFRFEENYQFVQIYLIIKAKFGKEMQNCISVFRTYTTFIPSEEPHYNLNGKRYKSGISNERLSNVRIFSLKMNAHVPKIFFD